MVTVRVAEQSDAHQIAAVHVDTWRSAYAGRLPQDLLDGLDVDRSAATWRRQLDARGGLGEIFVTERDGDPDGPVLVGFCAVGAYRDDPATVPPPAGDPAAVDGTVGEVYAIYVAAGHWSTGAGYALMRASVDHLARGGAREVRLWVLADNPRARRFYERFGFVADGTTKSEPAGAGSGILIDEVRYTLRLR
jgi:ribosomal protein S18 acetylase RimI-like enzyme